MGLISVFAGELSGSESGDDAILPLLPWLVIVFGVVQLYKKVTRRSPEKSQATGLKQAEADAAARLAQQQRELADEELDLLDATDLTIPTKADTGTINQQEMTRPLMQQPRILETHRSTKSMSDGSENSKTKLFLCTGIDFSHNSTAEFSLKSEMNKAGFRDIGDFFRQLANVVEAPTQLMDLSKRIARIKDPFFRTVVARLLNAVSYNSADVTDADIRDWFVAADLAGLGMNSQHRLSDLFFKVVHSAVTKSIRTRGTHGFAIVEYLAIASVAWEQRSAGETIFEDDPETARSLLVGVVLQAILHSLKSAKGSQNVIESLAGTKGQKLSLREELRFMTELGRQYARANGIDYDEFVKRHLGIVE